MFVAWCFLRRLRVLARGHVVHDVTEYNRVYEIFKNLSSHDARENQIAESTGIVNLDQNTDLAEAAAVSGTKFHGIFPAEYQTVVFKPFCGI